MPRAGFTAIHAGRIRFGRDGRWYCDGEPIANRAICQLYARAMTVGPDGRARLTLGEDRAEVEIEDTPWVVTGIDGDPVRGFTLVLNDETQRAARSDHAPRERPARSLLPGEGRSLRGAPAAQRLLRLARHAEPGPGGTCVLPVAGRHVPLAPASS